MWRGRVHGLWFAAAVAIAVIGVVALSSSSDDVGADGVGSWVIAAATFVGVAYCLFRASRRAPRPPSED